MAFTRNTVIDASPSGDSVKQAVLDLDADLTAAYDGLNQLQGNLALKINLSDYDQPNGVPKLDATGKLKTSQLPDLQADLPIGLIISFGAESLPANSNWLECDGSQVAIADYLDLYGVIGNAFGLADPGKFKLPDLRGQFLRGWNHAAGVDPDAATRTGGDHVGSSQADALRKHAHPVGANTGKAAGGESVFDPGSWGSYQHCYTGDFTRTDAELSGDNMLSKSPRGLETRPLNTAVMFCIKWR